MAAQTALTPSVSWAQRPKIIFLTINVSDVENPEIKVITSTSVNCSGCINVFVSQVEKDSLVFKGTGGAKKSAFELNMKFLKEVTN